MKIKSSQDTTSPEEDEFYKMLKEQLSNLSNEANLVIALRIALRVLPVLVIEKQDFSYWDESKKAERLEAIIRVLDIAERRLRKKKIDHYFSVPNSVGDIILMAESVIEYTGVGSLAVQAALRTIQSVYSVCTASSIALRASGYLVVKEVLVLFNNTVFTFESLTGFYGHPLISGKAFKGAVLQDVEELQRLNSQPQDFATLLNRSLWYGMSSRELEPWEQLARGVKSAFKKQGFELRALDLYGKISQVDFPDFGNSHNFVKTESVKTALNVEEQADVLASIIANTKSQNGDFIGLFGRWGRGKTFLWQKIKQEKAIKAAFVTSEFQAWRYQSTPAIWAYLYECLLSRFNPPVSKFWALGSWCRYFMRAVGLNVFTSKARWLLVWNILLFLLGVGVSIYWGLNHEDRSEIQDKIVPLLPALITLVVAGYKIHRQNFKHSIKYFTGLTHHASFVNHLGAQAEVHKAIVRLLEYWMHKEKKRLLLFIDDLDRCEERKLIQIIEALRIMADDVAINKYLVIVSAIDERLLKRAIGNKYRNLVNGNTDMLCQLVREQMDKVFLIGFKLPSISSDSYPSLLKAFVNEDLVKVTRKEPESIKNEIVTEDLETDKLMTSPIEREKIFEEEGSKESVIQGEVVGVEKERYEMTDLEYAALEASMVLLKEATPRTTRIYKIRFLMARRLLEKQGNRKIDSEILTRFLAYYGGAGRQNELSRHQQSILSGLSGKTVQEEVKVVLPELSIEHVLTINEWKGLLKVLEMVVPY